MKLGDDDKVKIQSYDFSWQIIQSYPLQTGIKIELDQDQYPRVKWYPHISQQTNSEKMIEEKEEGRVDCLRSFLHSVRGILLQILNQSQKKKFLEIQDGISDCRYYLLLMLTFVKWRSNVPKVHFFQRLEQELVKKQQIQRYRLNERQQISSAKLACIKFLDGRTQNAVRQLYKECQEGFLLNITEMVTNFQRKFQKKASQQSQSYPITARTIAQFCLKQNIKNEMMNKDNKTSKVEDNLKMNTISQNNYDMNNPFIIQQIEEKERNRIFGYECSLKPKRRILDYFTKY